ncbi:MAG: asparagine synthase (glutamine-hydrolyzing) [Ferruginibacter sp.]|nr:asparagine synthase (glutamine-hydrolyzing) [Ferruginibacter sp.]
MCGIAGSVNFRLNYDIIKKSMLHRGPDEQNGFVDDNVDLYHLRLSILDISGGKQPMTLFERFAIIFNGEIYNHLELRERFSLMCKTNSDTETILWLYQKLGPDFLQHVDGMFALAIYDRTEKKLFIARDRAGKKPVYIYNDQNKIVFASELNVLRSLLPLSLNENNFYHYLRLGVFYRNHTPYQNVTEIPGGTYWLINTQSLEIKEKRWWDISKFYEMRHTDSFEHSVENTDRILQLAVKRRVESSDLEVGCFLSGGIDSGLVTAMASKYSGNIKTVTMSFEGEYNEAPLAKKVAEKYNTSHQEISISFDSLRDDVEKIIANYGEPFSDSSAIPSYYVSREAKKYVTVILNGDGADELFGGYRRYVPFSRFDFFKKNRLIKNTSSALKFLLPSSHNKKSAFSHINRLISLASKSDLEMYLSAGVDIMEDYEKNIFSDASDGLVDVRNDFRIITDKQTTGLRKIMNMDFDTNLFSDLLVKMDIATMAHSLEGRSPFLAKEMLEYVPGLKDSFKVNRTTTKYILRTLAKKYLPQELIHQPKRGFEIPLKKWVNGELNTIISDYLNASNCFHKNYISQGFTQKLLENKIRIPAEKRAKILWMLFCMEVWNKKVYLS